MRSPGADVWPLACPVCGAGLERAGSALACPVGHSFDLAREGYVNLVPAQHRERGIEGDTADMLRARRRFLDLGHYTPLLDRLTAETAAVLTGVHGDTGAGTGSRCLAEIGCGEGYYIGGIAAAVGTGAGLDTRCVGVDVSKAAARLAAKRYPHVTFIVANVRRQIYLLPASVTVLLSVFAPRNPAEFARVVAPGGHLLIVIPSPAHLASLRAELDLIGVQDAKESKVVDQLGDAFTLVGRSDLRYPLELQPAAVQDLVAMGPNRWHRPPGGRDEESGPRRTEASFVILHLQRNPAA